MSGGACGMGGIVARRDRGAGALSAEGRLPSGACAREPEREGQELGREAPGGGGPEAGCADARRGEQDPPAPSVRGAGFGDQPRQLRKEDFGQRLIPPGRVAYGENGRRMQVLWETLESLERASPDARYHRAAQRNLARWRREGKALPVGAPCSVLVRSGDWGDVTGQVTREFGTMFAVLNMANARSPGGGYADGMIAQEENMFRRTDCHFSLDPDPELGEMDPRTRMYLKPETELLNGKHGRVYLDVQNPRVCIRGAEDRESRDLGYPWLAEDEVFPFLELRAAAVDLRRWGSMGGFDKREMRKRIAAQFETLKAGGVRHAVLSAFGCGAFLNPAPEVARLYREELEKRLMDFDLVVFAVFDAGYGPDNFLPFKQEMESLVWAKP